MIADAAFLSSSPWQTDHLVGLDSVGIEDSFSFLTCDLDLHSPELNSNILKTFDDDTWLGSCGTASECSSEDLCSESQSSNVFHTDLLSHNLLDFIDEPCGSVSGGAPLLCWDDDELSSVLSDTELSDVSRCTSPINNSKPWSSLSVSRKMAAVEKLTEILSGDMGVREKVELLQILNPGTDYSQHTHFIIDLESIDDDKMEKIEKLVRRQESEQTSVDCPKQSPHHKPLTKAQRRLLQKEARQKQRKEQRQMRREKRSGLFKQEQVMSLSRDQPDSCEDIDILT